MNLKKVKISIPVYFLLAALLISYFYPREGKFRYSYAEGKPWKYGLLTAPFDFPIYKSESEVKREQDSVLQSFRPYFQLKKNIQKEELQKFNSDYQKNLHETVASEYARYIEKSLNQIYSKGVISNSDKQMLEKNDYNSLMLMTESKGSSNNNNANNIFSKQSVDQIYTVQSAYNYIINNIPPDLEKEKIIACNINNYIEENIIYDHDISEKVKNETLQQVSLATGLVQAGERIVDRGIIIDNKTFNILNSLKIITETRSGSNQRQNWTISGVIVLITGILFCFFLYLYLLRPKIYHKKKDVFFILSLILIFTLLTEITVNYSLFNVYIIPYVIIPIVICTFFDTRTALFAHIVTILACSMAVPFPSEFIILQIIAGMTAIFSLSNLTERSQLIRSSFFVLISYILIYVSLTLIQEGSIAKINWKMFLYFGINFIFLMFTYTFVYLIEKLFGYTSGVSLVEMSNTNTPLLRKFSETCPGSFQHSLQVSILATAAASKIGANIQLVRTGALYHDIGKMSNPGFYTENMSENYNPHSQLTFEDSAKIIISHVNEGVKIAQKYNLPQQIIDFIQTHHGRGKAKYFYNSFKNAYPDKEINEELFTYPGPNPFSKETAILMMADSVEAASRSLKEYTEQSLSELVEKMINYQINEGLLKNTPLTFRDIEDAKTVFNEKLKIMYHTRIAYPDLKT